MFKNRRANYLKRIFVCLFYFSICLPLSAQTSIDLTNEEASWLEQHQSIEIGVDGNWAPIDFIDKENQHQGILADTLALLSERLGVEFKVVPGPTFKEMLKKVMEGQLKVGTTIVETEERARKLVFADPYFVARKVIATRKEITGFKTIQDLHGKTVAIEKGYFTVKLLQEQHPEINLLLFDSTLAALQAVSWGQAEAYVGNQAVIQWQIHEEQLVNISVTGDASFT